MTDKVQILIELVARLRVARLGDESIAKRLGLSRSGLSRILSTPEYKAEQDKVLREVTGQLDSVLKARSDYLAQEFSAKAVPEAMKGLLDVVRQRKDLRSCLMAAKEILDRDTNETLPVKSSSAKNGGPVVNATKISDTMLDQIASEASLLAT